MPPALTEIQIGGLSANQIYSSVIDAGLTSVQASEFVGVWLLANANRTRRAFGYKTDFPAVDPDCVSHFARSFFHQEWRDGQHIVQAEESAGEDGFNLRFHRIENDLDALGADVAEVFLCVREMRASLRALLDELQLELNTIEGDLADLKARTVQTAGGFPVKVGSSGTYVGTTQFLGTNVDVFRDPSGQMFVTPGLQVTGGTFGVTDPDARIHRAQTFAAYAQQSDQFRGLFASGAAVSKARVVAAVGADVAGGMTVKDLLAVMPDDAAFVSADAFVAGLSQREGLALRTSGTADAAVTAAFPFRELSGAIADASITEFEAVPEDVRNTLAAAGIKTVGQLATTNAAALAKLLAGAGVPGVATPLAAQWIATATVLNTVR